MNEGNGKRGLGAALFLVCGVCVAEANGTRRVMPSYAETAFPKEMRASATTNLCVEAMRCRSRSCHVDGRIVREIGKDADGGLVRTRVAKRQEVRDRAQTFAEANLRRGGADGLGFAEQSLADVEEINRLLEDELRFWKTAPRANVRPVVLNLRDFGAAGDGVADDAAAFARANAALRQLGCAVRPTDSRRNLSHRHHADGEAVYDGKRRIQLRPVGVDGLLSL